MKFLNETKVGWGSDIVKQYFEQALVGQLHTVTNSVEQQQNLSCGGLTAIRKLEWLK